MNTGTVTGIEGNRAVTGIQENIGKVTGYSKVEGKSLEYRNVL